MTNKLKNPSAFPRHDANISEHPGMTLRDYFAGQAMISIFSHADFIDKLRKKGIIFAIAAYEMADVMLAAREAQS